MQDPRHLLVIMPHTGECFSCCGTVVKHTRAGGRATIVCVCSGEGRLGEAWTTHVERCASAAAMLGAQFEVMDFLSGGWLEVTWENKIAVAEVVRRIRPDIMITIPAEGLYDQPHCDHAATHQLVYYARDLAARTVELPSGRPPHYVNDLYFLGDGSHGDIFIDVTDVADVIRAAREEIAYMDLRSASHGALPLAGGPRSLSYQRRAGDDMALEAFRSCYYREKTLPRLPR